MGSGRRGILAWAAAAIGAGGIAFALGALGLLAPPTAGVADVALVGAVASGPVAYDCPGGEPVARFSPGSRIFVTARNADTTWLLTRSPAAGFESVWVRAESVSVDEFPVPIDQLAVVSCETVVHTPAGGDPAG